MHFCGGLDDLIYLLMLVPGAGMFIAWLKAKLHHRKKHNDCGEG